MEARQALPTVEPGSVGHGAILETSVPPLRLPADRAKRRRERRERRREGRERARASAS